MSLEQELKIKTEEMLTTNCKNSHKRTRLILEMKEIKKKMKYSVLLTNDNKQG